MLHSKDSVPGVGSWLLPSTHYVTGQTKRDEQILFAFQCKNLYPDLPYASPFNILTFLTLEYSLLMYYIPSLIWISTDTHVEFYSYHVKSYSCHNTLSHPNSHDTRPQLKGRRPRSIRIRISQSCVKFF